MTEAEMQGRFTRALRAHGVGLFGDLGLGAVAVACELKVCRVEKLLWKAVEEHQILSLGRAAGLVGVGGDGADGEITGRATDFGAIKGVAGGLGGGLVHKISDSGLGFKPFDCFYMRGALGVLVVGYNGGRDVVAMDIRLIWDVWRAEVGKRGGWV